MSDRKLTQMEAMELGTNYQYVESIELGPFTSYSLLHDARHMAFVLARYKFCKKMLEGKRRILEVGCGDGFGTPILAQNTDHTLGIDIQERVVEGNTRRLSKIENLRFQLLNICEETPQETFDGACSIDVIEHLDPGLDDAYIGNVCRVLVPDGVYVVGTPNITASQYASPRSEVQHINLKSHQMLKELMQKYFRNVFMFGMNDEVLHTGYPAMCHYLFAVGASKKEGF